MKAIVNGKILLPDGEVTGKALLFDKTIVNITDEDAARAQADEVIDANGMYVSPGFVDVHIHGYLGEDTSDANPDGVRVMSKGILENGVTSWLPTTMTVEWDILEKVFEQARALKKESESDSFTGAEILGLHAEGPFINPSKKGAQKESAILAPDADKVLPYKDVIRLITIAPEMAGGLECIKKLHDESDIAVSVGHTGADYTKAMEAFGVGADHVTHTFNAMTPLNHRDPGVVGAALTCDDAYCELIADTFHINRNLFKVLTRMKKGHLVLITDCTRAGGMADGEYTLGGQPIFVKGIECRLADGTIAGSVLKMNNAVKNLATYAPLPVYEAVKCASLNPAKSIRMEHTKGSLERGKDADVVLFDDSFTVHKTFVRGVCKYERK